MYQTLKTWISYFFNNSSRGISSSSSNKTRAKKQKSAHWKYYPHPQKSWLDWIFSVTIMPLILPPLHEAKNHPFSNHEEAYEFNRIKLLKPFDEMDHKNRKTMLVEKYKTLTKADEIIEILYQIPRIPYLLHKWGIIDETLVRQLGEVPYPKQDKIELRLHFPIFYLNEDSELLKGAQASKYGFLTVTKPLENINDLYKLHLKEEYKNIPVIVGLHGGGLTLGTDSFPVMDPCFRLIQEHDLNFITAVLTYSLAPEYPFPIALEETLVTLDHLNSSLEQQHIHLYGESAGSYLGLVSLLELMRLYLQNNSTTNATTTTTATTATTTTNTNTILKVKSALLLCPMCDPKADSMSYYMESASSYIPPSWLRWCWQGYLNLKVSKNVSLENSEDDLGCFESNRTTFQESIFGQNKVLERLVRPIANLPIKELQEAQAMKNMPKIFISTNRADPLYCEGKALVEEFQKDITDYNEFLYYFDHPGSHAFGSFFNGKLMQELVSSWVQAFS